MKTLDLNEAAEFLRLHPHTLEARARTGEIPGAKPGKCWVFIDVDLADWLRSKYRSAMNEGEVAELDRSSAKSAARELEKRLAGKSGTAAGRRVQR